MIPYVTIHRAGSVFDGRALGMILEGIREQTASLTWSLQHIWAVGNVRTVFGVTMLNLENNCSTSVRGMIVSYEQLLQFSDACDDIIEVLVVGCADAESVPKAYRDPEWEKKCQVIISYHDSTFWSLWAEDPGVRGLFDAMRS